MQIGNFCSRTSGRFSLFRRMLLPLTVAMGILAAPASPAAKPAGVFPSKPITLVVGFPPGGPNDRLARELGDRLAKRLNQPVIVENRPGANSEIAAAHVARSTPDGHTLLFTSNGALAVSPNLKADLPYNPARDLTPVAIVAQNPMLLVVSAASPYRTLADLLDEARKKPGKLTYASAGVGSPTQLAAELLKVSAGIDALHVPYKGGGPALVDLVGGQVDFYFGGIATALPLVQSGRLRALAVTSEQRSPQLSDIGTVSEQGLPGYVATLWYSVMAPAGTPADTVGVLHRTIADIMASPDMQKTLEGDGSTAMVMGPEQFRDYLRADTEKWAKVIKAANLN